MQLHRGVAWVVAAILVVFLLSLVLGQLLGAPVLVTYVESGSMAPTIDEGDGFIAIPSAISGDTSEGDVIVFDAEHLHDGGIVTHRVVGQDESGYLTRGDANPAIDQEGREPAVQEPQIMAEALTVGDAVVVIPHLGTGVAFISEQFTTAQQTIAGLLGTDRLLGTQGLAYLVLGLSVAGYLLGMRDTGGRIPTGRQTTRDTGLNVRVAVIALIALLLLTMTLTMVYPSGPYQVDVTSTSVNSSHPEIMERGETEQDAYRVPNAGLVPIVTYLEGDPPAVTVEDETIRVPSRSVANTSVAITAPDEPGQYRFFIDERRYLAILPGPILDWLYDRHPWAPLVAINAVVGIPMYVLGMALLGTDRLRERDRRTEFTLEVRLRRWLARLGP